MMDHWRVFTKRLFGEWDADPGYYAIQHSNLNRRQSYRLAVAWCTYYNLGIAAEASELEGKYFWKYLVDLYPTAKRASERRHFRGNAGLAALEQWRTRWPKPEALVGNHMCFDVSTYMDVRKRGQKVAQYGDYFYWKWCDLHEVLGFGPVDMRGAEKYSPKVPQQGALLIYGSHYDPTGVSRLTDAEKVVKVYDGIASWAESKGIPPRTTDERAFGIQEAETVCCVYKQMLSGKYTYGTRTAKALRRLRASGSSTAAVMAGTLLRLSPYTEAELNKALDSLTEK